MTARAIFARALLAALSAVLLGGASPRPSAPVPQPRLTDFIAPPGTQSAFQPFMLHADVWIGIDKRARLDTLVYALENGARTCRVTNADSLWAVDYTWIYPHSVFPPRWYDARELLQVGDSISVPEDAVIQFTFGTCRIGVRAHDYASARAEALKNWPPIMPQRLAGRLRLKLERAQRVLRGEPQE